MLELDAVTIATPERLLVRHLTAQVAGGEVLTVMGDSGCGKSTLLGWLCGDLPAGFLASGGVRLNGRDVLALPTAQRRIGMLFQDDLLFPHMNVMENLLFAVPSGEPRGQRIAIAEQALRHAGLDGHGPRMPASLSGGQRARVSVLRALLAKPEALLLDEPFSRLDAALRQRFRAFVFERIREQGIPALLVTHDPQDVPHAGRVVELKEEADSA